MADVAEPYTRYLRLLGIDGAPSGLEGLRLVVRRHLCCVPFENVSKLLLYAREGAGRAVTVTELLDGIEYQDLGGTCYTLNPHLGHLLRHLGYDVDLVGADMTNPNVHTCLRVHLDGVPYHVDVGYGGPFREPMRLDRVPYDFQEGALRYVLDRNRDQGAYEMSVYSGEERRHGYIVHAPPRDLAFFDPVIRDSFVPGRTFMSWLRVVRFSDEGSVELTNRTLRVHRGSKSSQIELNTRDQLQSVVSHEFAMPRCPIDAAVTILERLNQKPLFD